MPKKNSVPKAMTFFVVKNMDSMHKNYQEKLNRSHQQGEPTMIKSKRLALLVVYAPCANSTSLQNPPIFQAPTLHCHNF